MEENYFKIILTQEAGDFGNTTEKRSPKLKKYVYYIFTNNIVYCIMQVAVFCKNVLKLN